MVPTNVNVPPLNKAYKFAVIVWATADDVSPGPGVVYSWYNSLASAVNTATNLMQSGAFYHAVAVKMV